MIGTISRALGRRHGAYCHSLSQYAGDRLATRISSHEPEVTLVAPNGGESFTGATISGERRTASDDDYVTLELTPGIARMAAHGGILANGLTGSSLVLDASLVEGTPQGKFRIVASDGVNTAQDDTDGVFGVPNKRPDVTIMSPSPPGGLYLDRLSHFVVDARDLKGNAGGIVTTDLKP